MAPLAALLIMAAVPAWAAVAVPADSAAPWPVFEVVAIVVVTFGAGAAAGLVGFAPDAAALIFASVADWAATAVPPLAAAPWLDLDVEEIMVVTLALPGVGFWVCAELAVTAPEGF